MLRRNFLCSTLLGAGALATARMLRAEAQCGPIYMAYNAFGVPVRNQVCAAGISSITFKSAYQKQSEWCWAACISMVFGYFDHPIDQQRIVKETWDTIRNMPAQPADIMRDLNRKWTDDRGNDFESQGDSFSVNMNSSISDLQDDKPLIIGALGHATVLTGITSIVNPDTTEFAIQSVTVRDPWPGNGGKRVLTPYEWGQINFAARIRVTDA